MRVKQLFLPDSTRPATPFSCTEKWSETMSSNQHSTERKRCTFVWTRIFLRCASLFTLFELWSCYMRHPKEHQWRSNKCIRPKAAEHRVMCYTNRRIHILKANISRMDQWERITKWRLNNEYLGNELFGLLQSWVCCHLHQLKTIFTCFSLERGIIKNKTCTRGSRVFSLSPFFVSCS